MFTISFRRKIFFLLLVMLLCMPWAVSSAPIPRSERPRVAVAAEKFALDALSRIWSYLGNKAGCNIDPSGHCAPEPAKNPPGQTKEGCHIDPDGCTSQNPRPQQKEGCNIDPDGRCVPAPYRG